MVDRPLLPFHKYRGSRPGWHDLRESLVAANVSGAHRLNAFRSSSLGHEPRTPSPLDRDLLVNAGPELLVFHFPIAVVADLAVQCVHVPRRNLIGPFAVQAEGARVARADVFLGTVLVLDRTAQMRAAGVEARDLSSLGILAKIDGADFG